MDVLERAFWFVTCLAVCVLFTVLIPVAGISLFVTGLRDYMVQGRVDGWASSYGPWSVGRN